MRRATRLALSTIPSLLLIVVVEIFLTVVAPVPDPYEELKQTGVGLNQYIKSEYPPNLRLSITPEEGLAGVEGSSVETPRRDFRFPIVDRTTPSQ